MRQVAGIWLPDDDTHFAEHLLKGPEFNGKGTYQYKKIKAALEVTPKDRRACAVDVGAHVGTWTRVLSSYFKKVVAFEPIPSFVECWEANCKECSNAFLLQGAVSDYKGHLSMAVVPANTGNSRVAAKGDKNVITVNCCTLDEALADVGMSIDFIKIDVEGWESKVIEGAENVIKEHRPIMVIEQKPGNAERYGMARDHAVTLVKRLGYEVAWEIAGDYCVRPKKKA